MRAIFGALTALFVPAFGQDSQTLPGDGAAAGQALIEGSVVNKVSGAPVKGAHVMFAKLAAAADDASQTYTDTDSAGRYSAQLESGRYRIWVERPGFSRLNYGASTTAGTGKILTLAPGQQLHDLSFRISPLGAISGRVLDEDGDPVQGAGIQVLRFSYATGKRIVAPVGGTSSNDRGEYRVFSLPPGRYFLLVTQPGAPLSQPLRRGMLVADAQDFFAPLYYPGVLQLSEATPLALGEGAEAQDIDIRLQRIRVVTLRGRLLSPVENFPQSQLQVVLAPRDIVTYTNRATATVDRLSGRFEFHNVAPGSYVLFASQLYRDHTLSGRLPIDVTAAGHPEEISIPLIAGSEIPGNIELEGAAPDAFRDTRVVLTESEGLALGPPPSAQIERGGAFRIAGVTPGVWEVSIAPVPKGVWVKSILFDGREIPGGSIELASAPHGLLRIVLSSNGAQLSGTVTHEGQPSRSTVVLIPAAAELRAWAGNYFSTSADDQGNFALAGVRPGSYKLFAFEDAEPNAWLDPDFLKSVDAQGQDVTLGEGDDVKKQVTAVSADAVQPSP